MYIRHDARVFFHIFFLRVLSQKQSMFFYGENAWR